MLEPTLEPWPSPIVAADHEFDFRSCTTCSSVADTGVDGSGITATTQNGPICSVDGIYFDGSDDYMSLTFFVVRRLAYLRGIYKAGIDQQRKRCSFSVFR